MNKTQKLFHFLEYIVKHKKYCTKELSNILDTDIRTIQRYKKEIEEYFQISFLQSEKGCYSIPDITNIKKLILEPASIDDFSKMVDILSLANHKFLDFLQIDKKILKQYIDTDIYLLKESPFEELVNFKLLFKLKQSIKYRQYIDIEYNLDQTTIFSMVKPLKILFANNNWYLAVICEDELNNGFRFLRINFIKDIQTHKKTFQQDIQAQNFIKNFQSLYSGYKKESFEVIVQISSEVKRFFKVKKFLPSQKIVDENDDFLTLSYQITNDEEILFIAKTWLPYFKIISPQYLDTKLKDIVSQYLTKD